MTENEHESASLATYMKVGTVLLVGTVSAYLFAEQLSLGWGATVALIFSIASVKAGLVGAFFMHLKYEPKMIHAVFILPVFLVPVVFLSLVPDVKLNAYRDDSTLATPVPQKPAADADAAEDH